MALALVRLTKRRGNRTYAFLDYMSEDVARLGVEIQGGEHSKVEWAKAEIVRVFNED